MVHRRYVSLALVVAAGTFGSAQACSSSSNGTSPGGTDAGSDGTGDDVTSGDSSGNDAGLQDASPERASDAADASEAAADAPPIPPANGVKLASAAMPGLVGVTSDGYVVYFDFNANTLYAASISGPDAGAPSKILDVNGAGGKYWFAVISGSVVFAWGGLAASPPAAAPVTAVWSKATGTHAIATETLAGIGAASGDGSNIVYVATSASGATGDITVAGADGSNPTVLVSQAQSLGSPTCVPQPSFVGAGKTDAVIAYCMPTDAATTSATLDAFRGANWTQKNLATGLKPSNPNLLLLAGAPPGVSTGSYVVDSTSTNILAVTSAGEAIAIAYPAANASNLESSAATPAFFVGGGGGAASAVYSTQGGAVHATPVPAGTPTTLVASGASYLYPVVSPDGKWSVYGSTTGTAGGLTSSDLTLFATATPATTKSVTTSSDGILGFGSVFTADSTHFLWYDTFVAYSFGYYEALHSMDLATGSPTLIAQKTWMGLATANATSVVYNDGVATVPTNGGMNIVADIELVDVAASPLAPKLLQKGADPTFLLTPDAKSVIYAFTQGSQSGVYTLPAQ